MRQLGVLALVAAAACGGNMDGAPASDLPAPSGAKAIPLGTEAHVTWKNNAPGATGLELERKTGGAFAKIASFGAGATSYHDSSTSGGTTYYYRLRATAGSAHSAYSNEARVDIPAAEGPPGSAGAPGSGGVPGTGGMTGPGGTTGAGGRGGSAGSPGTGGAGGRDAGAPDVRPPDGGAPDTATPPAAVSFQRDIVPALVKGCGSTDTTCHNRDQAVGRYGSPYFCQVAWLSTEDAALGALFYSGPNAGKPTGCPDLGLYQRLTTLKSMLCGSTTTKTQLYVVPRDLNRSLIYQVVAGADPSLGGACKDGNGAPVGRMPKAPYDVLKIWDAAMIKKLADWITAGAPNN
jgi:hypothetical protein